jgi:transposase-like protein
MTTGQVDQRRFAQELVEQARAQGIDLVGQGGLLTGLMKSVLETALEAEMTEHLGYDKHDVMGRKRRQLPQWHPHQDGVE